MANEAKAGVLQGTLDLMVLQTLATLGPQHGYAIAARERNHQGKGNVLLFPGGDDLPTSRGSSIECGERLGGLLKYYYRRAA